MLYGRLVFRYALGALIIVAAAAWIRGWGWLLLWIAVSLAAQAMAYARAGSIVFHKKDGRLSWPVRILLAPYMIGARITLHYYCRGLPPWIEATPGVWIGRRLTDAQAGEAIAKGVTAALDLTAGFPECDPLLSLRYRNIQLLPVTVPTVPQLREGVEFIEKEAGQGIVIVHGALGYSRSVGVVAAYLLATGQAKNVADAVEHVRKLTPVALLHDPWTERLNEFNAALPVRSGSAH